MPWLALPFEDRDRQAMLSQKYGVSSIPNLTILDSNAKTITTEARVAVPNDLEGKDYPWAPPLVQDLGLGDVGRLNELPSLICLCEAADEATKARTLLELKTLASEYVPKGSDEFAVFVATKYGGISQRIRELSGLQPSGEPQLLLVHASENGAVYVGPSGENALTVSAARALLGEFEAGRLTRQQLFRREAKRCESEFIFSDAPLCNGLASSLYGKTHCDCLTSCAGTVHMRNELNE